jgi:peptidoglycan/LPS O-acetylase OafA/YrhL
VWESNTRPCKGIWWSHFLYLNDLYPWWNQRLGEVCYGHSWYLANDMQYYLLVPLLCLLYRSTKVNGKKLAGYVVWACLLSCVITSWVLSIKDKWSPNSWDGVEGDHYREEGFSRPWTRCSSYMIGILFSYYWYEKKQNNPEGKLLPIQANLLWVAGLFLLAIAMYGPHTGSVDVIPCNLAAPGTKCGSGWSPETKAAIIALLRPTWTLGLGFLSVLCWNNQGGFIQKFLAAPAWAPLNTLSFCIYLVHYTVLTYYISQRTLRIRFELFGFLNSFFGLMAVSCGLALFVVLLVEKPFMKLQKLYFTEPAAVGPKKGAGAGGAGAEKGGKMREAGKLGQKVVLLDPPKKAAKPAAATTSGGAVVAKI